MYMHSLQCRVCDQELSLEWCEQISFGVVIGTTYIPCGPGGPRSCIPGSPFFPFIPGGPTGPWSPSRPSLPSLPCWCSSMGTLPQKELLVACSVGADAESALLSDLGTAVAAGEKMLACACHNASGPV